MKNIEIKNYHIHLYYDSTTQDLAQKVVKEAKRKFDFIEVGRFHQKNVGPHPRWSVQILVPLDSFGEVFIYFSTHREGLTVFTHANTGDDLVDHTDYAVWMGEILKLNLEMFD